LRLCCNAALLCALHCSRAGPLLPVCAPSNIPRL
jgi:hypothetical protein